MPAKARCILALGYSIVFCILHSCSSVRIHTCVHLDRNDQHNNHTALWTAAEAAAVLLYITAMYIQSTVEWSVLSTVFSAVRQAFCMCAGKIEWPRGTERTRQTAQTRRRFFSHGAAVTLGALGQGRTLGPASQPASVGGRPEDHHDTLCKPHSSARPPQHIPSRRRQSAHRRLFAGRAASLLHTPPYQP